MGRVSSAIPKSVFTTIGDIIAASAVNTPSRIAAPALGLVLTGQGVGVLPAWTSAAAYTQGARAYHNASQSIATGSTTILAFNSERFDTDSIHDNVTNNSRLTCQTAGKYLIIFHGYWDAIAGGVRLVEILLGGATSIAYVVQPLAANEAYPVLATIYDLAVTNYVEVRVWQNSGSPVNMLYNAQFSPEFMMQRIG